jgi:hypothetical protein
MAPGNRTGPVNHQIYYPDHIRNFSRPTDKGLLWQDIVMFTKDSKSTTKKGGPQATSGIASEFRSGRPPPPGR